MNHRLHSPIVLLVAIMFLYSQMAGALTPAPAGISQSANGATFHGGGAGAVEHIRHIPGQLVHASGLGDEGDTSISPSAPFPVHHYCGPDVGTCTAIVPGPLEAYGGAAHRSFDLSPLLFFSDLLPSHIPHPPKTVS